MGSVLVTGASRGIGRGIARELARSGHRVAIHYNGNREAALAAAEECRALYLEYVERTGGGASGDASGSASHDAAESVGVFQANISLAADRERLVDEVAERFGEIDGLVNNAGIGPRKRDDIVYAEEEIFDEVLRVNLYGPYFLTQLVVRRWLARVGAPEPDLEPEPEPDPGAPEPSPEAPSPRGRVVFVTSVSAEMVSTSRGEYCVSKAGLAMAAQLYAARLAGDGILVYEIRPGIVKTDMTARVTEKYDRLIGEGLVPQKRWGYPKDTGTVVSSIMGGHLDFSPGSVIHTDGGLHISQL